MQATIEIDIYDDRFLIARPLLQVLNAPEERVLLVDEIDRSDHEFEAFCWNSSPTSRSAFPSAARSGETPADRHPDLQPHARTGGSAAPALRLSLDRLSRCRARGRDHHAARRDVAERPHAPWRAVNIAPARWPSRRHRRSGRMGQRRHHPRKGGSPWPEAFRRAIGVLIKDEEDLSYIAPELGRIVEEALA